MNPIYEMLASDKNLDAHFRSIFAPVTPPIKPSDDDKDPQQKPAPVSQEDEE